MQFNICLVVNYNLDTDILYEEEERSVIQLAYLPFLDILKDVDIKSHHFFTGVTAEHLQLHYPEVIDKAKLLIERKRIEMGSHTYGHAILPLLPMRDACKQIELGVSTNQKIFGRNPQGFYPPEWCYDPTLPKLCRAIDWLILLDSNFVGAYDFKQKDIFEPYLLRGIEDSQIPVAIIYGGADDLQIRNLFFKLFENKIDSNIFIKNLIRNVKELDLDNKIQDPLVLLYFDTEALFLTSKFKPVAALRTTLESLVSQDSVEPVFISAYLEKHKPSKFITPKLTATYKPIGVWQEGSQKLDILLENARQKIHDVEQIDPTHPNLELAWKNLLMAESSDARIALYKNRLEGLQIGDDKRFGNFQRTLKAYDCALKVLKLLSDT